MSDSKSRKIFSLMLSDREKKIIKTHAQTLGLSANAYIRMKIFNCDRGAIDSTRSPLADNSIPETDIKIYRALCDIATSLRELANIRRDEKAAFVKVDRALLCETLNQVKQVAFKLATLKR